MGLIMPNQYFQFRQFIIQQDKCAMKVTTDACLFGAWSAEQMQTTNLKKALPQVLDIGTGTGLLSLMVAQKNNCLIDAIEIERAAARQAVQNINASQWMKKIFVHHSDALLFDYKKQYDVIISNPPFYENELRSGNDKKNKAHHDGGLKLAELTSLIKKQLSPEGNFYLLLPYKRKTEIENLLKDEKLFVHRKCTVFPSVLHNASRCMVRGANFFVENKEEEIFVQNKNKQYTPQFISLLQDYYLNL
jgi:tRNA1Val (adenine37-N6)-methyltransferase